MFGQVLQLAAGAALVVAALCALVAVLVVVAATLSRDPGADAAPGLGCALLGLLWALIGLGLLALAKL